MRKVFLACSIFFSLGAYAQDLGAGSDSRGHFIIFDSGNIKDVEYLPVQSWKMGYKHIAYVDNSGNFKIYYNGNVKTIQNFEPQEYVVTQNFVVFRYSDQLKVFDDGEVKTLTIRSRNYAASDSVIAYYDGYDRVFKIYYKGESKVIEVSLSFNPAFIKATGNMVTYQGVDSHMHVYYGGQDYDLNDYRPTSLQSSANVATFNDNYTSQFYAFYKGEVRQLENFKPKNVQMGIDLFGYIDNQDNFKIFSAGNVFDISTSVNSFVVNDSVVFYEDNRDAKIFYKGKEYLIGRNLVPKYPGPPQNQQGSTQDFTNQVGTIAYYDSNSRLVAWENEDSKVISYEQAAAQVNGNVITFTTGINTLNFYWHGKVYTQ